MKGETHAELTRIIVRLTIVFAINTKFVLRYIAGAELTAYVRKFLTDSDILKKDFVLRMAIPPGNYSDREKCYRVTGSDVVLFACSCREYWLNFPPAYRHLLFQTKRRPGPSF